HSADECGRKRPLRHLFPKKLFQATALWLRPGEDSGQSVLQWSWIHSHPGYRSDVSGMWKVVIVSQLSTQTREIRKIGNPALVKSPDDSVMKSTQCRIQGSQRALNIDLMT